MRRWGSLLVLDAEGRRGGGGSGARSRDGVTAGRTEQKLRFAAPTPSVRFTLSTMGPKMEHACAFLPTKHVSESLCVRGSTADLLVLPLLNFRRWTFISRYEILHGARSCITLTVHKSTAAHGHERGLRP